jgi:HlyD family secretion protein
METGLGRRVWVFIGIALALTVILLVINGRVKTANVNVFSVARQSLDSIVSSNGKVEPENPIPFRAGFPTFVERVYVVEGQQVKRGQVLYQLDDKSALAQLAKARADLAEEQETLRSAQSGGRSDQVAKVAADLKKAQQTRDQLRHDNESLTKLVAGKAATQQELERNRVALAQSEADVQVLEQTKQNFDHQTHLDVDRVALLVEHSQNEVRDLEEQVRSAHAVAPIDGTLYAFPVRQGDFVKTGDLLAEMADLHHVHVRAFIDEPELGQISSNQPVDIFWDAHPDHVWKGRTEVVPKQVVSRGSRNVGELLCSVSNEHLDLLPNTSVDVRIQISKQESALVVPRGAVYIDGSRRFAYRADGDRLHRADIKVGIANPTMIQVLSGLNEGDIVALPGDAALKENLRIRAVRPE